VVAQTFPGTVFVNTIGAVGRTVLSEVEMTNYTNELVLANLATNHSALLEVFPPTVDVSSVVGAGGRYFVALYNGTYNTESYQEITPGGGIKAVALALGSSPYWQLIYGNATALVASSLGSLVALDPATGAIAANYSAYLPARLGTEAVLPVGPLLYLAGGLGRGNATSAYLGVLNRSSRALARLAPLHFYASPYGAEYFALGAGSDGNLYVGGGETYFDFLNASGFIAGSIRGFLGRYDPSSGGWTDLRGHLPARNASVFGIEPWGATVALNVESYALWTTGTTYIRSWFEEARASGNGLRDRSSLLPAGFVGEPAYETAFAGGYTSLGGYGATGLGETVSVKT
jgi:hypothetical protein